MKRGERKNHGDWTRKVKPVLFRMQNVKSVKGLEKSLDGIFGGSEKPKVNWMKRYYISRRKPLTLI